jgi:hypothetical protein
MQRNMSCRLPEQSDVALIACEGEEAADPARCQSWSPPW